MGLEHCDAPLPFLICARLQSAPFYRVFGCNKSYTLTTFQTSQDIAQKHKSRQHQHCRTVGVTSLIYACAYARGVPVHPLSIIIQVRQ